MPKRIPRRQFLGELSAGAIGLAGILATGCSPELLLGKSRPNLLLITIDTLRADHLGCYGYPRNTSPNIDKFASNNILFENYFTVTPITGPSTASLFTGRYMQNHGVVYNWLKKDATVRGLPELIPEDYRKAGFTANAVLHRSRGYAAGFEEFLTPDNLDSGIKEDHSRITHWGIQWLEGLGKDENYFLWLHYIDPHGPYMPSDDLDSLFLDDEHYDPSKRAPLKGIEKQGMHHVLDDGKDGCQLFNAIPSCISAGHGANDEIDYYVAKYDSEIRYTDREVGKVLDFLNARKLMDNTIVAISADHGESLYENSYYFSHGMLVNEGSIHIPLLMSHPEVKEPLVVSSLLQNTDLAPTLLGEFGVEFAEEIDGGPAQADGIDFSDVYAERKPNLQLRPFIFSSTSFEYGTLYEAVRTHSGKLVRERQISYGEDGRGLPRVLDGESFYFYDLSSGKLDIDDRFSSISDKRREQYLSYLLSMEEALSGNAQVSNPALSEKDRKHLRALGYIK